MKKTSIAEIMVHKFFQNLFSVPGTDIDLTFSGVIDSQGTWIEGVLKSHNDIFMYPVIDSIAIFTPIPITSRDVIVNSWKNYWDKVNEFWSSLTRGLVLGEIRRCLLLFYSRISQMCSNANYIVDIADIENLPFISLLLLILSSKQLLFAFTDYGYAFAWKKLLIEKQLYDRASSIVLDIHALPFKSNSVDTLILSIDIANTHLSHIVFRECYRVLRSRGILILNYTYIKVLEPKREFTPLHILGGTKTINPLILEDSCIEYLGSLGFRVLEIINCSYGAKSRIRDVPKILREYHDIDCITSKRLVIAEKE